MTTKIFTVAQMVSAERAADASGVAYDQMMETAGCRVAEAIMERKLVAGKNILVLVGPGNNGGDGLVAGRYLAEAGADVAFYLYKQRDVSGDVNLRLAKELGLFIVEAEHDRRYRVLRARLKVTDILVDALLGTGVTRPIEGNLAGLLKQVKTSVVRRRNDGSVTEPLRSIAKLPKIDGQNAPLPFLTAVDCPSGLNCDTGELDQLALTADMTVTFAGPKRGHFRFPGASACGELVVADIGISNSLPEVGAVQLELVTPDLAVSLLPLRSDSGHKGTFGTVLIAAGSEQYWGAPVLAGLGAYRAGAGLVALAVPEIIRPTVAGQLPEATFPPVPAELNLDGDSGKYLLSGAMRFQSFLVGPGLGQAESFIDFLLMIDRPLPSLVIDADGLNILADIPDWYQKLPANSVLTPHPGEMARLLNRPLPELKSEDRIELARQAAIEWGHVVLLKGAYTVIAAPTGDCALLPFANPLLAVGGSGDVLSGVIAAFLAQGVVPFDAAILGGYLHGAAGELAVESFGHAGMLAEEIADWIPRARQHLVGAL